MTTKPHGYVGVFSPEGSLVAYTKDKAVVREFIILVLKNLPERGPDRYATRLLNTKKEILKMMLGKDDVLKMISGKDDA